jgi:hypothetical protein
MLIAAETLASQEQLDVGCPYLPLSEIRNVSVHIAVSIAENAHAPGVLATEEKLDDMMEHVRSLRLAGRGH